ncbi:conserved hypothetical protein [Uncinocarpus reesii 1704]|uniref:Uncharacterized protein n=1 Tax=Uncinocarpus reesii (strain UAMH 1704) TaxID=336963 RepID=C4JQZ0_UNCRE|nr:uncharacterized protein UREG_03472 [Uncinocarpus reesii 1704]EEP78626.1 conserved hypothetical protein [Uncinocarpus reesii 1704]
MSTPNQYVLAADNSPSLLPLLRSNPSLASAQDAHGYSLLHAAASYGHLDLLRSLVREFHVDINLTDEDGDTCLFVAETVELARCLVEELGIDKTLKNDEGLTAEEAISSDGSFPDVAAYLRGTPVSTIGDSVTRPGPSLPPNVTVNFGTMTESAANGNDMPDPEFKRRIDELASRENFHSEENQRELRDLVTAAIRGVNAETQQKDVRRRLD